MNVHNAEPSKIGHHIRKEGVSEITHRKNTNNKIKKRASNLIFLSEKSKKGPDGSYRKLILKK